MSIRQSKQTSGENTNREDMSMKRLHEATEHRPLESAFTHLSWLRPLGVSCPCYTTELTIVSVQYIWWRGADEDGRNSSPKGAWSLGVDAKRMVTVRSTNG
jgi:hypothetical protein